MWPQLPLRSCCPSWTLAHNHHYPSKWTRSSSPTSKAVRPVPHNPLPVQRGPSHLGRSLHHEGRGKITLIAMENTTHIVHCICSI